MLDREHQPGTAHARLHLVHDQQHAVLECQRAQALKKLVGRHEVAPLPLNRFEHDRGDFVRRYEVHEQLVLEEVETLRRACVGRQAERTAIAVGEGGVKDARHHRSESAALDRFARGHREGAERPAVKPAEEGDQIDALGRIARQLDARLDGFRAGVSEECPHAAVNRRNRGQLLGELDLRFVVEIGA